MEHGKQVITSTKELIIRKAVEVFNKHGLEYFGIRELAKELNMKAGNITYYFPTKNHLITEIASRCTESSTGILDIQEGMNCYDYLEMLQRLFHNQYQYRSLLLSLPHIVREIEPINVHYKASQELRKISFGKVLHVLHQSGSIEAPTDSVRNHFVDVMLLIIRFWISDYAVNESIQFKDNHLFRHIDIVSEFLLYFSTKKGKDEIAKFQSELQRQKSFQEI